MTLSEKSAYLKGLMEGMKLDTETNEGKLISEIISMLQDVAENVSDLEEVVDCISDELDCIEEDLDNIDDYLMDDDDEEDGFMDDDGADFDSDDDTMYEVTCQKCGEVLHLDEETLLNDSVDCPKCGEPLEFEFDEDDGLCSSYAKRRREADPSAPRLFAHRAVLRHSLAGR